MEQKSENQTAKVQIERRMLAIVFTFDSSDFFSLLTNIVQQ